MEHLASGEGQEGGGGDDGALLNEFEQLQVQREMEFMAHLCQGLPESVPQEIAEAIEADLGDRLHQTVCN